jgi:hypothetical protein
VRALPADAESETALFGRVSSVVPAAIEAVPA